MVSGADGKEEWEGCHLTGTEFQFFKVERVLEVGGTTNVSILTLLKWILKNGYDDKFSVTCILPQFFKKQVFLFLVRCLEGRSLGLSGASVGTLWDHMALG